MKFDVTETLKWENDVWEKLFQLISDFKTNFKLSINSMGKDNETRDKFYYTLDKYTISFEVKGSGFYISLKADTTKDDFDKKLKFILEKIQ